VLPNGNVACSTKSGLAVYAPVTTSGTPPTATSGNSILPPVGKGEELVTIVADVALRATPGADAHVWLEIPEAGTRLEFMGEVTIDAVANVWYHVRSIETSHTGYIRADQLAPEQ
jgi:hypothetical protein